MKLLTSGWVLAVLAALMNLGLTGGLIYCEKDSILHGDTAATAAAKTPRFWSFHAEEVDALIAELKDEQVKMETRQTELDNVAAHLNAEKEELEKTRTDVVAMQDEISTEVVQIQDSEKKNVKTLAQTYASMSPTAVVAIFRDLDEIMCVKVLSQMKPDKVGAILEEMSQDETMTKRAASISDKLSLMKNDPKPQI